MSALALLAVVTVGSEPVTVGAMPLHAAGLADDMAGFYSEHFAAQLAAQKGLRVMTQKDIGVLLGIERQKQLLGCDETSSSCLGELAGAMGAEAIATGDIAKVGAAYQVNIKLITTADARVVFVRSSQLLPAEEQIVAELNTAAVEGTKQLLSVVRPNDAGSTRLLWSVIPVALGAIAGGVSAGLLVDARAKYVRLDDPMQWPSLDSGTSAALRDGGKLEQTVGVTLLVGCGVLIVVGLVGWLIGGGR
jgi:hypothetical protein